MNKIDLLSKYKELNSSFSKKIIYRFNDHSGFFSEYNNMILAMVYCLDNKLQFQLASKNQSYSYADIFIPFCEEIFSLVYLKYNHRDNLVHRPWLYKHLFKWGLG